MFDIETLDPGDKIQLVNEEALIGRASEVYLIPDMRKFLGKVVTVLEVRQDEWFGGKPYVLIEEDYEKGINGGLDHFGWLPATIAGLTSFTMKALTPASEAELSEFLSF